MKLTIERDTLRRAVKLAQLAATPNNSMPVLAFCKVAVKGSEMTVEATDLCRHIKATFNAENTVDGAVLLPLKRLAAIAGVVGSPVTLDAEGNDCKITSGGAVFNLSGISESEFPPAPNVDSEDASAIDAEEFVGALKKVMPAASRDENRYILNGIHQRHGEVAATDGKRLHLAKIGDYNFGVTIPASAIAAIMSFADGKCSMAADARTVKITCDLDGETITFFSRLVEGKYPEYNQVIPRDVSDSLTCNRERLIKAIETAATVLDKDNLSIRLEWQENYILAVGENETAKASDILDAEVVQDGSVTLNYHFILDALKAIKSEDVTLCCKDSMSPVVINDSGDTYVIMPLRQG